MTEYFLPMHVYFCHQGDAVVFLDLKNDEYTMIDGNEASVFRSICSDRRDSASREADSSYNSVHNLEILDELVKGGLLTTATTRQCKPVLPTATNFPMEHLVGADTTTAINIQVDHVWRFLVSCAIATLRLRLYHIETTINAVRRRKILRSGCKSFDFDRARQLVTIFNKLRYWFPTDYLCLFDSLALIEFLARYDIFPDWIFAVRPALWAAHCWIQKGEVAFNEGTEEAEDYIPIMVV